MWPAQLVFYWTTDPPCWSMTCLLPNWNHLNNQHINQFISNNKQKWSNSIMTFRLSTPWPWGQIDTVIQKKQHDIFLLLPIEPEQLHILCLAQNGWNQILPLAWQHHSTFCCLAPWHHPPPTLWANLLIPFEKLKCIGLGLITHL